IIRNADAPEFGEAGTLITGYASPTRGSESVAAWKVSLEPGAASPRHELTHDEVFIVLTGQARFEVEGRSHDVGAGDAICVPPRTVFALSNAGAETMTAICCMAAGGQARMGDREPFPIPWAQ
ncbi:MAG: cupin domain-containing protein, partial [Solirubrobacteraceae bacterium]